MKLLAFLLLLGLGALEAKEYYAKLEPYEVRTVSSNVTAQVVFADETRKGTVLGADAYIRLDSELDSIELEKIVQKIALLEQTLKLDEAMHENYVQVLKRKSLNYDRIKELKIKSSVEKDREFYDLIATRNSVIGVEKEIANLKVQINDLGLRKAQLERNLKDKTLSAPGFMLYEILVKPSQVVNIATPLAKIADVSRGLLTLYLNEAEMQQAKKKVIYLDGVKTAYRIDRLWSVADETHLSSYKAEIIVDAPEHFSNLLKVELRDE